MENKTSKTKTEVKQEINPKVKKSSADSEPSVLFTKKQLISSKKYESNKDALSVILEDDKSYSFEETDKLLNNFMKGMVN